MDNKNTERFTAEELRHFPWLCSAETNEKVLQEAENILIKLRKSTKHQLVMEMLEYRREHDAKVGITKQKDYTLVTLRYWYAKSKQALREVHHQWKKFAENPDIKPEDIFKDFVP